MASLVTPITIRGRYFWKGDERFLIKGVAYRQHDPEKGGPGSSRSIPDPLADDQLEDLKLSIPLFKDLGLNTLLVYTIDDTKSHDAAMDLLAEAGIYVLACLETPHHRIDRAAPLASYTPGLVRRYLRAADALARYANTLGLVVASEATDTVAAAAVARALVRDVRRYMRILSAAGEDSGEAAKQEQQQRVLPLGVSASSVLSVLMPQFAYLSADGDGDGDGGAVDFFSFNCYSWCGKSTMEMSGYDAHVSRFAQTPIPVFFSEYGANTVSSPRLFQEARALCSPRMTGVFSGGIVYEFFASAAGDSDGGYGLVRRRRRKTYGGERETRWPRRRRSMTTTTTKDREMEREEEEEEEGKAEVYLLERTQDFKNLQTSLRAGAREQVLLTVVPEFAAAAGSLRRPEMLPGHGTDFWPVDDQQQQPAPPACPLDWEEEARSQVEDRQWVDVGREIERLEVEDLAAAIGERLRIGDTGP
ncbi:Glucanosyltransferase-domain-containing protein [Biscogniauxia mediterranea]|nr:Glucanosyltransferase-domain-containing protein [Biscogniauxia mediterranea]